MWLIENLFIMEIQRLIDLGKQMHLEGEKLCEFVLAQQAVARDERIRISQEKKESRIAAKAEKERIAAIEDEDMIAAKAEKERITAMEEEEKIRQRKKEDEASSAEKAARIRRHEEEDEEEKDRVRRHEEEMCHLRMEADNIRRRRMLQQVWKDAEERRREEEDEGECSISVTDRELWRKCFREQEALARKEATNTVGEGQREVRQRCTGLSGDPEGNPIAVCSPHTKHKHSKTLVNDTTCCKTNTSKTTHLL